MTDSVPLFALVAPVGHLTGNGQLRETISERRNRKGNDVPFWYLPPELVLKFGLGDRTEEIVVAEEITAINWLQLRFGGEVKNIHLEIEKLRQYAMELPPKPFVRDISVHN